MQATVLVLVILQTLEAICSPSPEGFVVRAPDVSERLRGDLGWSISRSIFPRQDACAIRVPGSYGCES